MIEIVIYATAAIVCYTLGFFTGALLSSARLGDVDIDEVVVKEVEILGEPEATCTHAFGGVVMIGDRYTRECRKCGYGEVFR